MVVEKSNIKAGFINFVKENSFFINCSLISLLFLANCFLPFFSYIAFAYVFVMIIVDNLKNDLGYIFFSLPFAGLYIPISVILFFACIFIYIIKFVIIKAVEHEIKFSFSRSLIIFAALLLAYLLLPFSFKYNINLLIKVFSVFALLAVLYLIIKFPKDVVLKDNFRILAIALLIASIFYAFRPLSEHLQEAIKVFYISDGMIRFSGLFYNPNIFALICEIGVFTMAYYIMCAKTNKKDVMAFLIFLLLGIMTFSKTYIVIMSIVMVFLTMYAIKTSSKQAWFCVGAFVLAIMLVVAFVPKFILVYLNRFGTSTGDGIQNSGDEIINTITTGRLDVWKGYIKFLLDNPLVILFGSGFSATTIGVYSTHNMYLGLIYQIGIVGTALLCTVVFLVIKNATKGTNFKFNLAIVVPILCILLIGMIEDFIFYVE